MNARKRIAVSAAAVALFGGLAAVGPTASATAAPGGATAHSASVREYQCDFHKSGGYWYAGHYDGMTRVPSSRYVTRPGGEAQCLLRGLGYDPGPVDGIFGDRSQTAMRKFQHWANRVHHANLAEDGFPGPHSWPWLRKF